MLSRDLHFRDNFKSALDDRPVRPGPGFSLADALSPRGSGPGHPGRQSNMFDAETLTKLSAANPRIAGDRASGSHDLAGDNPDGLVAAVHDFLSRTETVMTGVQPD